MHQHEAKTFFRAAGTPPQRESTRKENCDVVSILKAFNQLVKIKVWGELSIPRQASR
jgi:hypothetical protein